MSEKKYNVDSFNLDHTKVFAPFVRKAATKIGAKGDVVTKFYTTKQRIYDNRCNSHS